MSGVGPLLTLLGTFGGVWVVVILFRWFQRDFAAVYRVELTEERALRAKTEDLLSTAQRDRWRAEAEAAWLRSVLARNGIDPGTSPFAPNPQPEVDQ